MECRLTDSVHFDVCESDHLRPLLGGIGNQRAELRWRHRLRLSTQRDKTRLHRRIGDDGIDVSVENIDDFSRRAPLGAPTPAQSWTDNVQ